MKVIKDAQLSLVCGPTSALPDLGLLQIAFAGKSNVGKSSLINALMNRKNLARTSSQPGKTQTINFYEINHEVFLVDLPGYGYAKASREAQAAWGKLIEKFLSGTKQLRMVFLLVDIRHDPGSNDVMMYDWIVRNGYEPVIIATKLDKIKRSQVSKQLKVLREGLGLRPGSVIIPFSALTKQGRDEIWDRIDALAEPRTEGTDITDQAEPETTDPEREDQISEADSADMAGQQ